MTPFKDIVFTRREVTNLGADPVSVARQFGGRGWMNLEQMLKKPPLSCWVLSHLCDRSDFRWSGFMPVDNVGPRRGVFRVKDGQIARSRRTNPRFVATDGNILYDSGFGLTPAWIALNHAQRILAPYPCATACDDPKFDLLLSEVHDRRAKVQPQFAVRGY